MNQRRGTARSDAREQTVAEVLLDALPETPADGLPAAPLLLAGDVDGHVAAALGPGAVRWSTIARHDAPAAAWPPPGDYGGATVRMPKAKAALDVLLHAVADAVPAGAPVWVYGAHDEGIKSIGARLEPLLDGVSTIAARKRCRVWRGARNTAPARAPLTAWQTTTRLPLPGGEVDWHELPGVFAAGRLDVGTARLLAAIDPIAPGARVLDFGCGAGAIGAAIRQQTPTAALHLLDADAVAIEAARLNVPGATLHLGDGWRAAPGLIVDRIVSNPPIHRGKREDHGALWALIDEAPRHLSRGGVLELVVQRRVPIKDRLEQTFRRVESLVDDPVFSVWRAR